MNRWNSPLRPPGISAFCQRVLRPLPRSDQRRWGEVYVRGLVTLSGRKSMRRIAEHVVGAPVQHALQQFVNQSPWDWQAVRHSLARQLLDSAKPRAWSVEELIFPKNGDKSVGVAPQYVPALGRTVRCQTALSVFMLSDQISTPVNWRLMLPRDWQEDHRRRRQASVPDEERCRPHCQYLFEMLDEMISAWNMPPLPVVADVRHARDVSALLDGLEARGLSYVLQVSPRTRIPPPPGPSVDTGAAGAPIGPGAPARTLAELAARHRRIPVAWWDPRKDRPGRSRFAALRLGPGGQPVNVGPRSGARMVATELGADWQRVRQVWVSNLDIRELPTMVALAKLGWRSRQAARRLSEEHGLHDFEGRSFRGWHHHVTLVSLAHAFRALTEFPRRPEVRLRDGVRRGDVAMVGA